MKSFSWSFLPLLCSFLSRGWLNVLLFIIILFFWGEGWITDCHEFSRSRESLILASLGMIFRCEMSARVEAISFKLIVSITVPLVFVLCYCLLTQHTGCKRVFTRLLRDNVIWLVVEKRVGSDKCKLVGFRRVWEHVISCHYFVSVFA